VTYKDKYLYKDYPMSSSKWKLFVLRLVVLKYFNEVENVVKKLKINIKKKNALCIKSTKMQKKWPKKMSG